MSPPLRIAMWSGPRNISTAMMRAWENRGDCAVSDEPLYAHYLDHTGADHPARERVIAAGETDWRVVVEALAHGAAPESKPLWYQKHMCHHLLPHMARDWIDGLHNLLLIRDPAEVVASYLRARGTVEPGDIGVLQQIELFDRLAHRTGAAPLVIDAGDFLAAPEAHLRAICAHLGIAFTERMLHWPPGPRDSDGVWAPHWYAAVWASTGFEAREARPATLDANGARVVDTCRHAYERLHAARLRIDPPPTSVSSPAA